MPIEKFPRKPIKVYHTHGDAQDYIHKIEKWHKNAVKELKKINDGLENWFVGEIESIMDFEEPPIETFHLWEEHVELMGLILKYKKYLEALEIQ